MATEHPLLKVGDTVDVTPSNEHPRAIGRGRGTVVHVGPTGFLVRVQFPNEKYPLACFAEDCKRVEAK